MARTAAARRNTSELRRWRCARATPTSRGGFTFGGARCDLPRHPRRAPTDGYERICPSCSDASEMDERDDIELSLSAIDRDVLMSGEAWSGPKRGSDQWRREWADVDRSLRLWRSGRGWPARQRVVPEPSPEWRICPMANSKRSP